MTELADLTDDTVLERARHWRSQALRGVLHARGFAHEYEQEARRRFPCPPTIRASVQQAAPRRRTIWKFWLR